MRISFNKLGFKIGTVTGAFLASIFGAGLTTLVFAAIPHSATGIIDGCFDNTSGALRVIDKQSSASCGTGETAINWNQKQAFTNMVGADMSGAKMVYMDLRGSDLTDAHMDGADLRGNDFRSADLTRVAFTNSNLSRAKFNDLDLRTVEFTGTTVDGADFSGANLENTIFNSMGRNLNFSNVNFAGGRIQGQFPDSNFTNTNFTGATFIYGDLTGVDFTGANLTDVVWDPSIICPDTTYAADNGDTCINHL